MRMYVLDILLSDSAIVLFAAIGLVTTTVSIVLDARAERERVAAERFSVEA